MTQFTIGMDGLDEAILAADQVLADVDPDASRLALAAAVTLAVLPKILEQVEEVLAESRAQLAGARAANAHVRDKIRTVTDDARAQTRRITRVFEEIDPDAVTDQILHLYATRGDRPDGRDRAFTRATVHHAIQHVAAAISLSLSTDERTLER